MSSQHKHNSKSAARRAPSRALALSRSRRLSRHLSLPLSLALTLAACDDTVDAGGSFGGSFGGAAGAQGGDPIPLGGAPGGVMTAGVMTAGVTTGGVMTAGVMTGGAMTGGVMTAGAMTGGVMTAGAMTGGAMMGGVMTAGAMTGGVMTAGVMTGGAMTGGAMMGGAEAPAEDPCLARQPDPLQPCPVSLYEARDPRRVAVGRLVTLEGTLTAIRTQSDRATHWVLQTRGGSPEGLSYSAMWVYLTDAVNPITAAPARGDLVRVTAMTGDFYGERQLKQVVAAEVVSAGAPLSPVAVSAAEVSTSGARAAAYEGLLVRVAPVEVTEVNPAPGAGDTAPNREFVVAGGLRVNDFLYAGRTLPAVGERWGEVVGVLRLGNGDYKLEPRDAADLGRVDPTAAPTTLVINEVDYQQPGADAREFVEIKNAGPEPVALAGVRLELVNGGNLMNYRSTLLSDAGEVLEPGAFLVLCTDALLPTLPAGVLRLRIPDSTLQNGPDGLRLTAPGLGVIDALGYGMVLDEGGTLFMDSDADPEASLGRCRGDSGDNATDFDYLLTATPGAENACQ